MHETVEALSADAPVGSRSGSLRGATTRARWFRRGTGVVLVTLAVGLPLLRQSGVHSWRTIWAEDGALYYAEADRLGGLSVLFRGYAGYLQLPPRILALGMSRVPTEQLSIYLALAPALVAGLLAWFVYRATDGWVGSRLTRLVLAALVVLMPCLIVENVASVTNLIWTFAAVVPWALISMAEKKVDVATRSAVAFLAATSTAIVGLFLPLAIGFALYRRTKAAYVVVGAYLAGLSVQGLVVTHTTDQARAPVRNSVGDFVTLIGQRIFGQYLLGERGVSSLWVEHGTALVVGSTSIVAMGFLVSLMGAERRNQVMAMVLAACAFATFAFPVWGRGTSTIPLEAGVYHLDAMRYSVVPIMLLASAFALLVAPVGPSANHWIARVARPIFIAQLILVMAVGFSDDNFRSVGPAWPEAMRTAYENDCKGMPSDTEVGVMISPNNWALVLSCAELQPR